jgi:hypothetical protein
MGRPFLGIARRKENCRLRNKKWRALNPKRAKEIQEAYRKRNPEKMLESYRAYKKRHPGKAVADWKQWLNKHPGWSTITAQGYLITSVPDHPRKNSQGMVFAHRIVAEKNLGRLLMPGEVIHHRDGNKLNNEAANLMILSANEHSSIHEKLKREEKRND